MKRYVLMGGVLVLGGAVTACGVAPIKTVKVPVPVECRAEVPARPAMPTEALFPSVNLDRFAAAAVAEIELREGYEGELREALKVCTAVIAR